MLRRSSRSAQLAAADPKEFGSLAAKHSEDPTSASVKGLIQPIRKHLGNAQIEQAAFGLKDGEVSPVISIGNQYVILFREAMLPGRDDPARRGAGAVGGGDPRAQAA